MYILAESVGIEPTRRVLADDRLAICCITILPTLHYLCVNTCLRPTMKYIIATVLFTAALAASAQSARTFNKPVVCGDRDSVVKELAGQQYQEQPVWFGREPDTNDGYSLFVNQKTGTWTLIQFDQRLACIIGAGTGSRTIFGSSM
jgi:hypothetical protein